MTLIESKTLGTAQASIEFTSIPQDGTDLFALVSLRSSRTGSSDGAHIGLTFNNVASGYSYRALRGNGSAASSFSSSDVALNLFSTTTSSSDTANTFGNNSLYIPNYTSAANKSLSFDAVYENNATTAFQHLFAGFWSNTAAITSIKFAELFGNNWVAGSTISLYKITKGSDGIVTTS
jgi:hypothetical protein